MEKQTIPTEQLQAFLTEAKASGVYEMYYIELSTGLQRGELLGLKWPDIDWKNGIITVRRQIARVNGEITAAPLKTKNSYRRGEHFTPGDRSSQNTKCIKRQRIYVSQSHRRPYLPGQRQ